MYNTALPGRWALQLLLLLGVGSPGAPQYTHIISASGTDKDFMELLQVSEDATALEKYPQDENGECPLVGGLATLVPYDGKCATPLSFFLCNYPFHWLVLNKETGEPECTLQHCHNEAFNFNGTCMLPKDMEPSPCPPTKELVYNLHGEAYCDCPYTHVYHDSTDKCYVPYTRGPCAKGYSLQKTDQDVLNPFECLPNICEREGAVPITESGRHVRVSGIGKIESYLCYDHWRDWQGPCPTGLSLQLNLVTKEVVCDPMDMGYMFKGRKYSYRACTTGSRVGGRCLGRRRRGK